MNLRSPKLIHFVAPLALIAGSASAQHAHSMSCGTTAEHSFVDSSSSTRPLDRAFQRPETFSRGAGSLEDGSLIDIMVVYTPAAAMSLGGTAVMLDRINIAMDNLNDAMTASGLATQFRLVHTEELVYTESGSLSTQLTRLRETDDGVMDEVHDLRDLHKADLVSLVTNSIDVLGIANFGYEANTPKPELGFSVITKSSLGNGSYIFAHEIGHNLGMMHDWIDTPCANGGQPFAKGYTAPDESFQTIMGSSGFPRVGHFSNPDIDFMGQTTGVPIGMDQQADNAMNAELAAPLVAKFRDRDMNANGVLDTDEIVAMTLADCNANGYPDQYEQDFNRNGIPDDCDIASAISLDLDLDGVPDEAESSIIRVNHGATGTGTGLDWTNAKTNLQDALALARASDDVSEIWVAQGTYKPSFDGQRARYFDLHGGTSLLGGFTGTESDPSQRPETGAQTILSGDTFGNDLPGGMNREDNTLHVLFANREPDQVTIDRFTITGGAADLEVNCGGFIFTGGGMVAFQADVIITNCEFTENTGAIGSALTISNFTKARVFNNNFHHNKAVDVVVATASGQSIYEGVGTVHLNGRLVGEENQFINNRVQFNEANASTSGVYIAGGSPLFANNLITDNIGYSIFSNSGILAILTDDLKIINSTIANNSAPNAFTTQNSGVNFNRCIGTLINSIVWNNSAGGAVTRDGQLSSGGLNSGRFANNSIIDQWDITVPGVNSSGVDPLFADPSGFDYSLLPGSPAIDMGDNTALPMDFLDLDNDTDTSELLPVDYAGLLRQYDDPNTVDTGVGTAPIVDAGAYEFQPTVEPCLADLTGEGDLNFLDVSAFLTAFGSMDPIADFTGEGSFNFLDVSAFLSAFGAGCP
ncbi:MAG: reprolysin-like metallopeptidase [Phycisphaerales bacterium]